VGCPLLLALFLAVVYGMPKEAVECGAVDTSVRLDEITAGIVCRRRAGPPQKKGTSHINSLALVSVRVPSCKLLTSREISRQ
jgi:hypothetical protein